LRLVTLFLAPGAPDHVTRTVAERGAFVDFERLARLQRLMRDARTTLAVEYPRIPARSQVTLLHPPFLTDYAGGDRALQVWRRDSTLHWVRFERLADDDAGRLSAALEFREDVRPHFRRVDPLAIRALFVAGRLNREERAQMAYDTLASAIARQQDPEAWHFLGRVRGLQSWCLGMLGRLDAADSLARQSLAIAPENADGHMTLAAIMNGRGDWNGSLAHLDTLLTWYPGYPPATMMRSAIAQRLSQPGAPAQGRRP
jgi:tetratricopeptide (TPR) repeat protein